MLEDGVKTKCSLVLFERSCFSCLRLRFSHERRFSAEKFARNVEVCVNVMLNNVSCEAIEGTFYHLSVKHSPVTFLGGGFGQWPPILQTKFCDVEESQ